jgi:hypothetical protein
MSASVLIEAVEAEGFGGGGVVAAAFGDVQVAGVFEGGDDGSPDGGQVGGPAAGAAGGSVFAERHVADVMVRLDGPVPAGQAGPACSSSVAYSSMITASATLFLSEVNGASCPDRAGLP